MRTTTLGFACLGLMTVSLQTACNQRSKFASEQRSGDFSNPSTTANASNAEVTIDTLVKDVANDLGKGDLKALEQIQDNIKKLIEGNTELFTYLPPSGMKAEFSEPLLELSSKAASKEGLTSDLEKLCKPLVYQQDEPTYSQILARAESCGTYTASFCIRSFPEKSSTAAEAAQNTTYLKSPPVEVPIPCPEDSFKGLKLEITQETTPLDSVDLELSFGPLVSKMYLTNDSECRSGGTWEPAVISKKQWKVLWDEKKTEAKVYAKFKDLVFEKESACFYDTVKYFAAGTPPPPPAIDNTPPSDTGVVINGGATYTNQSAVVLTLKASDATEMYVTNTPHCLGGGDWEKFTEKKDWILKQENAEAKVYVKYRDLAENSSACKSASIIHDSLPPQSPYFFINGGASITASQKVAITFEGNDADFVYLTNTAGCLSPGKFVAKLASLPWDLSQSNSRADVFAKFKDAAGNETSCQHQSILHNDKAPYGTGLSLNSGARYTNSDLVDLSITASGAKFMSITNNANCAGPLVWETYTEKKEKWQLLQKNSEAKVYIKFKDDLDNESSCIYDSIIHDDTRPSETKITILSPTEKITTKPSVDLSLEAAGADFMYVTNTPGCHSGGEWAEFVGMKLGWNLAQRNSLASVYVKFKDLAGNESDCLADAILHDDEGPSSLAISINDGERFTTTLSVAVNLQAVGASSYYLSQKSNCGGEVKWEKFVSFIPAWTLDRENASHTLYVKFKDEAGNTSECLQASITHDNIPPLAPLIEIASGADFTATTLVNLELIATNASQYLVTNQQDCAGPGSWVDFSGRSTLAWNLLQTNSEAKVFAKFRDHAGNETACVSDTIIHDDKGPRSLSISLDSSALYTRSDSVKVTLAADDASDMYLSNNKDCSGDIKWLPFRTEVLGWKLSQTNAVNDVYALFKDSAGNKSECIASSIIHDSVPPVANFIKINSGASKTASANVSLDLSATQAAEMYLTNTPGCGSEGVWTSYAEKKTSWNLAADQLNSTASVYVKFRDRAKNESSCITDTIEHEGRLGLVLDHGAAFTRSELVDVSLVAPGFVEMYLTNSPGCLEGGHWQALQADVRGWEHKQLNKPAFVFAKFRDAANSETECISDSIIHDTLPPSEPELAIEGGAVATGKTRVKLALKVHDATKMFVTNNPDCSGEVIWQEMAELIESWNLAQTNSTATVYAKFADEAGNESACVSDTIEHDDTGPSSLSLAINADAKYTSTKAVTVTLAASGASYYYLTNASECSGSPVWQPFTSPATLAWNLGQDNALAKVYVKYKDSVGNESACINDEIIHDNKPPSPGVISINKGAALTKSLAVSLDLNPSEAKWMYLTNSPGCNSGGSWQALASPLTWLLGQSNSLARVYAAFKDEAGNVSSCIEGSLVHDDQAPKDLFFEINDGDNYTQTQEVRLHLAATEAAKVYLSNTEGCLTAGSYRAYTTEPVPWLLDASQLNGRARVFAKFIDSAGNETACIEASILHDSIPPSELKLVINAEAASTTSSAVTVLLSAREASEVYLTNAAGCTDAGSWENLSSNPLIKTAWFLAQRNSVATVYAKFRDQAGNESACTSDTIVHDDEAPIPGLIKLQAGADYTNTQWVSVTVSASGSPEQMYLTASASCSSGGTWEAYAANRTALWDLGAANGSKHIYVKFSDKAGNISSCIQDAITFDNQPPAPVSLVIASGAVASKENPLVLALEGADATKMFITSSAGCRGDGAWEDFSPAKMWTLLASQLNNKVLIYAKFADVAGNESECVSDEITHDNLAPSSPALSINAGALYTNTTAVTLSLTADDGPVEMSLSSTPDCREEAWIPFATTKSWDLGKTNSRVEVYAQFRDSVGNATACVSSAILHDGLKPTPVSNFDDALTSTLNAVTFTWTPATDSGSGVHHYEVAIGKTAGAADIYPWTSIGNVTSINLSGLNLSAGTTYYGSVAAVDAVGWTSTAALGDGFEAKEAIIPLDSTKLGLGAAYGCLVLDGKAKASQVKCAGGSSVESQTLDLEQPVSQIAVGHAFNCVLFTEASKGVSCWGANAQGQLGRASTSESAKPQSVNFGSGADGQELVPTQISAGDKFACALLHNGSVKCWGENDDGELGLGFTGNRTQPTVAVNLGGASVKQIAAGHDHACVLLDGANAGKVKCWGKNDHGEVGPGLSKVDQLLAKDVDLGTLKAKQLSLLDGASCALVDGDKVTCWGKNDSGQLAGTGYPQLVDLGVGYTVQSLATGNQHVCALFSGTKAGQISCWGDDKNDQLKAPLGSSDTVLYLESSHDYNCALLTTGALKCWGKGPSSF